jgi:hypothetical protein
MLHRLTIPECRWPFWFATAFPKSKSAIISHDFSLRSLFLFFGADYRRRNPRFWPPSIALFDMAVTASTIKSPTLVEASATVYFRALSPERRQVLSSFAHI